MQTAAIHIKQNGYVSEMMSTSIIPCHWQQLRSQLLLQWKRLTARDLDEAGPNRQRLAQLIQRKYGIESDLVENYLRNFERTIPMAAN